MPLGWIDFSKSERNKILIILDLPSKDGALDELGIASIRDGFDSVKNFSQNHLPFGNR